MKKNSNAKQTGTQSAPPPITNYAEALKVVNNYAASTTNFLFPGLTSPVPNYADIVAQFGPVREDGLSWLNNIFPSMTQFPFVLVNQANDLFTAEATNVNACLSLLENDPGNSSYQQELKDSLNTLQQLVLQQMNTINNVQGLQTIFTTALPQDAATMQNIANEVIADAQQYPKSAQQLSSVATSMNITVSENSVSQAVFPDITEIWYTLDITTGQAAATLSNTIASANAAAYTQAQAHFQETENNWNQLMALAQALTEIPYQHLSNVAVTA